MSTLILLLPPQPRLGAEPPGPRAVPAEFDYVHSVDGVRVTQHGRAAPGDLPAAAVAVAVVAPGDVSFHRITVPRAPAARLRPALVGTLEEALLADEDDVHLALGPEARPGEPAWVAAVDKPWLKSHLDVLDEAGLPLERVVSAWWPEDAPAAHVFRLNGEPRLAWRDAEGAVVLPLDSAAARALLAALPPEEAAAVRWSATPEAAGAASEFAGKPVAAVTEGEQGLLAAASGWNLRQFDLAAQRRGVKLVRDAATRFAFDPAWRTARIGLSVLVALQLVGLNLRAWQEHHALDAKQKAVAALMHATFPDVRTLYDPPAQARQAIDTLRAAAGRPGDGDLETLLQAAESAWPAGRPPVAALRFETGRLSLSAADWTPQEIEQFRSQLRAAAVDVDHTGDQLVLSPSRGGPAMPLAASAVADAAPPTAAGITAAPATRPVPGAVDAPAAGPKGDVPGPKAGGAVKGAPSEAGRKPAPGTRGF